MSSAREKVTSVEQLKQLRQAASARFGKTDSNCLVAGSGAFEGAVSEGSLYFEDSDSGLLLFEDNGPFELLYYFIPRDAELPAVSSSTPVVLEELDSNDRRAELIARMQANLLSRGWALLARNLQVSTVLTDRVEGLASEAASREAALAGEGIALRNCDETMADEAIALWRGYLKTTDVPKDHYGFMDDASQHVMCAVDGSGNVCGVHWWKCVGGTCEVRHTVTHPDFYHKGIAFALLMASLADAAGDGCKRAYTYIDERNMRSLALYEKAGLFVNGKTSTQFILE